MTRLVVAPIVEGHGEYNSVRMLLDRVWREICGGTQVDVLRPIREKRNRLGANKDGALSRAVLLASRLLHAESELAPQVSLILILVDADDDLPCVLGPKLLSDARAARNDLDISCVVANVEYETWFVAAAASLSAFIQLQPGETFPTDPESARLGKGWIKKRFTRLSYSETLDQPRLTAQFDLKECRARSKSFDKLCRELQERFDRHCNDSV